MTTPQAPAGWYPDPEVPGSRRYWDGEAWTENRAPAEAPARNDNGRLVTIAVLAGLLIGVVMSMQNVSLITGAGTVVTGAAIAAAAALVSLAVRGQPRWLRIVAVLLAALAVAAAVYDEAQLQKKRDEISHIFPQTSLDNTSDTTIDATVPDPPEPTQTEPAYTAADTNKLKDKGWVVVSFDPKDDGFGGIAGTARIKNANLDTETAAFTFTLTKNGVVVGTLQGSAQSAASDQLVTVDLFSTDRSVPEKFQYTFQVDTSYGS